MRPVIFYLDDEPMNLEVFKMMSQDSWEVRTFLDPIEALREAEIHQPAVICSDQRMPVMTGVEFLSRARALSPCSALVLITGYSEEELLIESVRTAQVRDYVKKPYTDTDLEQAIRRALLTHGELSEIRNRLVELEKENELLRNAIQRQGI